MSRVTSRTVTNLADNSAVVENISTYNAAGNSTAVTSTATYDTNNRLTWCKPDSYYSLSDWKGTWDKEGGGVIIDQAIHSLDLANWFINDEPVEVQAHLSDRGHSIMEVDDTGV